MEAPGPNLGSPTVAGPESGPVFCFTGTVQLFRFVQAPPPRAIVGQLTTSVGVAVPILQTTSVPFGASLASVDGQTATVCGCLTFKNGQLAVDIQYVSPGVSTTAPGVSPLALVVLAMLGLLPAAS